MQGELYRGAARTLGLAAALKTSATGTIRCLRIGRKGILGNCLVWVWKDGGILGPGPGTALVILKYMIFKIVILHPSSSRSSRGEAALAISWVVEAPRLLWRPVPSFKRREWEEGTPILFEPTSTPGRRVYASDPNRGGRVRFVLRGSAPVQNGFRRKCKSKQGTALEPCEYATRCVYLG